MPELEFIVECNMKGHSRELSTAWGPDDKHGTPVLYVDPCPYCMDEARDESDD